jgi:hypothetical protein
MEGIACSSETASHTEAAAAAARVNAVQFQISIIQTVHPPSILSDIQPPTFNSFPEAQKIQSNDSLFS